MHHQYANSPLTEAVCEVRFRSDVGWDDATANAIYESLSSEFSRQITSSARFVAEDHNVEETLQFWREGDEDGVVILSPNALSVTLFQPYPGWDQFKELVIRVYDAYLQIAQPNGILRIGLRYINEITIPATDEAVDIFSYFRIGIVLEGDQLPTTFRSLSVELNSQHQDGRDVLDLKWRCAPGRGSGPTIELDLDYGLLDHETVGLDDVGPWLEGAHSEVHTVFEGLIRDELRSLFDKEEEQS